MAQNIKGKDLAGEDIFQLIFQGSSSYNSSCFFVEGKTDQTE